MAYTIQNLMNTSVDDCKCSLQSVTDIILLQELLSECKRIGHITREKHVARRIKQLEVA